MNDQFATLQKGAKLEVIRSEHQDIMKGDVGLYDGPGPDGGVAVTFTKNFYTPNKTTEKQTRTLYFKPDQIKCL